MVGLLDRAAPLREREYTRERERWGKGVPTYTGTDTGAHAAPLLEWVGLRPGDRVLDVATGPGIPALRAAALVGPGGEVVATDLTPEWSDVIAARCAQAAITNVTFRVMPAEALDFPDASFDVALCMFGLMFVPDPLAALREMRRILREGGRLGVVVWSTPERAMALPDVARLLEPLSSPPPADEAPPSPFRLGEPGLIERFVAQAGFSQVAVRRRALEVVLDDPATVWRKRVEEGPDGLRNAILAVSEAERLRLREAVLAAVERYRRNGTYCQTREAIHVCAMC